MNRAEACQLGVELFNGAGTGDLIAVAVCLFLVPVALVFMVIGLRPGWFVNARQAHNIQVDADNRHRREVLAHHRQNKRRQSGSSLFAFTLALNVLVLIGFLILVLAAAE